jgi:hypothetical protein
MRALLAGVLCLIFWLPVAIADDQQKPIAPAEAAKEMNEEVTLLMEVKSTGKSGQVYFLNSEEDFKDSMNFTIFIDKASSATWWATSTSRFIAWRSIRASTRMAIVAATQSGSESARARQTFTAFGMVFLGAGQLPAISARTWPRFRA